MSSSERDYGGEAMLLRFFFQAEDGIRDIGVTGVQDVCSSDLFAFGVARRLLEADTAGVYWFGVHALGESMDERDQLADGRARTFLPMVPPARQGRVEVAVVVPLRHQLNFAADGSVEIGRAHV